MRYPYPHRLSKNMPLEGDKLAVLMSLDAEERDGRAADKAGGQESQDVRDDRGVEYWYQTLFLFQLFGHVLKMKCV